MVPHVPAPPWHPPALWLQSRGSAEPPGAGRRALGRPASLYLPRSGAPLKGRAAGGAAGGAPDRAELLCSPKLPKSISAPLLG